MSIIWRWLPAPVFSTLHDMRLFLLFFFLILSGPAHAQDKPAEFFFPLRCTLGSDCWAVNYVDIDPLPEAVKDFTCQGKTYDDHKGTDFGVKDLATMEAGVDVIAPAPGKVLRVRDTEPDGDKSIEELESIRTAKKDCGNAVLIDHGNNLQTLYCHLKRGSVTVRPGEDVTTSQKIAQVGQSGVAEFPHLHFGVVKDGKIIDPYSGLTPDSTCGTSHESMWSLGLPMQYEPLSLFAAEFYNGAPDFTALRKNAAPPASVSADAKSLSFWVGIYGAQKGDIVTLEIFAPDGSQFANSVYTQERPQERQYYFTGRDEIETLAAGTYKAKAVLKRDGQTKIAERSIDVR